MGLADVVLACAEFWLKRDFHLGGKFMAFSPTCRRPALGFSVAIWSHLAFDGASVSEPTALDVAEEQLLRLYPSLGALPFDRGSTSLDSRLTPNYIAVGVTRNPDVYLIIA